MSGALPILTISMLVGAAGPASSQSDSAAARSESPASIRVVAFAQAAADDDAKPDEPTAVTSPSDLPVDKAKPSEAENTGSAAESSDPVYPPSSPVCSSCAPVYSSCQPVGGCSVSSCAPVASCKPATSCGKRSRRGGRRR